MDLLYIETYSEAQIGIKPTNRYSFETERYV